jgi:hypothetical protein
MEFLKDRATYLTEYITKFDEKLVETMRRSDLYSDKLAAVETFNRHFKEVAGQIGKMDLLLMEILIIKKLIK